MNASTHQGSAFVNCRFQHVNLFNATIKDCKLTGSAFEDTVLSGTIISGGDWSYVSLRLHSLPKVNFRGVRLVEADLYGCKLQKADFRTADLTKAILDKASLAGADLRGARTNGINWPGMDLKGVHIDFSQAIEVAKATGALVEE